VVLPHRALLANIAQIRAVIDISPADKVLDTLPLCHAFGLTAGALLPVLHGVGLFLYPSPLHSSIIAEIAYRRDCSILFGTGTFLADYGRCAHPCDFRRLRYVVAGAEALAAAVPALWFEKFGLRIFEGYGATETSPVLAVNTPLAWRSGTVGQLLPGIEFRLLPVAGVEGGGGLHVRGANLMAGYLKAERPGVLQPPASACGEGWYDTGDIVDIDAEGFLRVVGRVSRFAKVSGEMVSLETVEKLAAAVSPAGRHAASSRADAEQGEEAVLFSTDRALEATALAAKALELGLPKLVVPGRIVFRAELPRLGSGKIDYVTLGEEARSA
jgi:acyl-[acyl-carrier-protein]-phospholipid O-acyltransferase/long-chain-fatty-acid--[acyl-carrier-protein] ligase